MNKKKYEINAQTFQEKSTTLNFHLHFNWRPYYTLNRRNTYFFTPTKFLGKKSSNYLSNIAWSDMGGSPRPNTAKYLRKFLEMKPP